jgi:hypothetical protein
LCCCCKKTVKAELFPGPCSRDKVRALHATGDAPIGIQISAEVWREFNRYENPSVRMEMQNAQAAQMDVIRKNIEMQMNTVEKK